MSAFSEQNSWSQKFANAFRGIGVGIRGQSSFYVHLPVAVLVLIGAFALGIDTVRICLLLLCISFVLTTELANSSLEQLAKAITSDHDAHIRDSLDIASGMVLIASMFAAAVGVVIFASAFV